MDDIDQELTKEFALSGLRYRDPGEVFRQLEININKMVPEQPSKAELEARDKERKKRQTAWGNLKKHPGIMAVKADLDDRWFRKVYIDDVLTQIIDAYWTLREQQQQRAQQQQPQQPKRKK